MQTTATYRQQSKAFDTKTNQRKSSEFNIISDSQAIAEEKAKERDIKNAPFSRRVDLANNKSIDECKSAIKAFKNEVKERKDAASKRKCAALTIKNVRCLRTALLDSDYCQKTFKLH